MKILISSLSKKIPLVKAVREALPEGIIIGGDCDRNCLGKHFVDEFWEMPPLETLTPEDFEELDAIIPTRDGELPFYATHRDCFVKRGIRVMISPKGAIDVALDKLEFYRSGYSSIQTVAEIDELEADRYVVKERYGAGSRSVGLNFTKEEAFTHAKTLMSPIFQPYIAGRELSVDLYINQQGKAKGAITRTRDYVVNGESQITTATKNPPLEKSCIEMAEQMGLYGHVMFQVIQNTTTHVLECNPRFGGASTLSLAMGLKSFDWFLKDEKTPFTRSPREKQLIRYPKDLII